MSEVLFLDDYVYIVVNNVVFFFFQKNGTVYKEQKIFKEIVFLHSKNDPNTKIVFFEICVKSISSLFREIFRFSSSSDARGSQNQGNVVLKPRFIWGFYSKNKY